jgi:predicted kinase
MQAPTIYVFFGLIASGKSTLAELFAAENNFPCYNTDRVRKELAGIGATDRDGMDRGIYTPEFTDKTYQAMLNRAEQDLKQGREAVVLDGSYSREQDRAKVIRLAGSLEAAVFFILCSCSELEVKRRLALRAQDPNAVSDGHWEIFVLQKKKFALPEELAAEQLLELDTEAEPDQLLRRLQQITGQPLP